MEYNTGVRAHRGNVTNKMASIATGIMNNPPPPTFIAQERRPLREIRPRPPGGVDQSARMRAASNITARPKNCNRVQKRRVLPGGAWSMMSKQWLLSKARKHFLEHDANYIALRRALAVVLNPSNQQDTEVTTTTPNTEQVPMPAPLPAFGASWPQQQVMQPGFSNNNQMQYEAFPVNWKNGQQMQAQMQMPMQNFGNANGHASGQNYSWSTLPASAPYLGAMQQQYVPVNSYGQGQVQANAFGQTNGFGQANGFGQGNAFGQANAYGQAQPQASTWTGPVGNGNGQWGSPPVNGIAMQPSQPMAVPMSSQFPVQQEMPAPTMVSSGDALLDELFQAIDMDLARSVAPPQSPAQNGPQWPGPSREPLSFNLPTSHVAQNNTMGTPMANNMFQGYGQVNDNRNSMISNVASGNQFQAQGQGLVGQNNAWAAPQPNFAQMATIVTPGPSYTPPQQEQMNATVSEVQPPVFDTELLSLEECINDLEANIKAGKDIPVIDLTEADFEDGTNNDSRSGHSQEVVTDYRSDGIESFESQSDDDYEDDSDSEDGFDGRVQVRVSEMIANMPGPSRAGQSTSAQARAQMRAQWAPPPQLGEYKDWVHGMLSGDYDFE